MKVRQTAYDTHQIFDSHSIFNRTDEWRTRMISRISHDFEKVENQKKRNILNFDETSFRIDCMKEQNIIVPDDMREYYVINSENRRFLTIFEMINAIDDYSSSSMLIIQNQKIMINWFANELSNETRIISSTNDFTSDKIALIFLQHYIDHFDVESDSEWKLMLMNNHDSHITSEFIKLTNENHIRSFSLISHLTHCMQPLNVEIFQSYKHWHDVVIKKSVAKFNVDYFMTRFCQDLSKIRDNILSYI